MEDFPIRLSYYAYRAAGLAVNFSLFDAENFEIIYKFSTRNFNVFDWVNKNRLKAKANCYAFVNASVGGLFSLYMKNDKDLPFYCGTDLYLSNATAYCELYKYFLFEMERSQKKKQAKLRGEEWALMADSVYNNFCDNTFKDQCAYFARQTAFGYYPDTQKVGENFFESMSWFSYFVELDYRDAKNTIANSEIERAKGKTFAEMYLSSNFDFLLQNFAFLRAPWRK
ncbi:hypothetical protein [uncultured Duodenibacillus sp.]|uniref:hypothetical protein n=1 Tax=uncultured Duodenibacillus sp. TaxID=1980699 RepID=UPI002585A108|nr:hypothetical protein [uncultured Duodenibacillus sp.]